MGARGLCAGGSACGSGVAPLSVRSLCFGMSACLLLQLNGVVAKHASPSLETALLSILGRAETRLKRLKGKTSPNRPLYAPLCRAVPPHADVRADVDMALIEGIRDGSISKLEQQLLIAVSEKLEPKSKEEATTLLTRAQSAGLRIQGALDQCSRESDDQANADLLSAALQVQIHMFVPIRRFVNGTEL